MAIKDVTPFLRAGYKISATNSWGSLPFANDMLLLDPCADVERSKIAAIAAWCAAWGGRVNMHKRQLLVVGTGQPPPVIVGDRTISATTTKKYPGMMVTREEVATRREMSPLTSYFTRTYTLTDRNALALHRAAFIPLAAARARFAYGPEVAPPKIPSNARGRACSIERIQGTRKASYFD
eukprot:GHVT01047518.1.p1 GENE.GHVT01047518.1~~GHVT01047518.1.p1  ORF type:complete len:180 (-),score=12.71 GHVT01047518.1:797-1336(-)